MDDDKLESCVCSRHTRKSILAKTDVWVGAGILVILLIVAFFAGYTSLIPYVTKALASIWVLLFIIRLAMRHSVTCSLRWATMIILGALGGFGFLSF